MKLSKQTLRQMQNIMDFCDFDTNRGVATMHVHFKCAEEIVDTQLSTPEHPILLKDSIKRMDYYMKLVPTDFKVEFSITVDDYQGYNPEILLQAYKKEIRKNYYSKREHNKTINIACLILAIIGIVLLIIKVAGIQYEWFGPASTIIALFIISFLEIFSEVFFEESLIFLFINNNDLDLYKKNLRRLWGLQCCDKKNGKLNRLNRKALLSK